MSRRETTINVLLGSLLVFSLALPFALGFLALRLAIYLLDLLAAHFLPGVVVHEDIAFAAIVAGFLLIGMIYALRWRRWRQAFLNFAVVSGFGIVATSDLWFGNSPDGFWFLVPFLFLASMPRQSSKSKDIDRPQFLLGMIMLSVWFAIEAGLLGTGLIRQVVYGLTYTVLCVFLVIRVRKGWEQKSDNPEPSSASAA